MRSAKLTTKQPFDLIIFVTAPKASHEAQDHPLCTHRLVRA